MCLSQHRGPAPTTKQVLPGCCYLKLCKAYHIALGASIQVFNTDLALMVPTADLANHSFQHNSVYAFRASQGFFELKSSRAIKEREAVCISYGQDKTNAELMRDYGFFVPGNPHDRLDFAVSSWQQHSPVIAKPAQLLFKALNGGAAPLTEEERPQLLAGPFLRAVGLTGKVKAGKVQLQTSLSGSSLSVTSPHVSVQWSVSQRKVTTAI